MTAAHDPAFFVLFVELVATRRDIAAGRPRVDRIVENACCGTILVECHVASHQVAAIRRNRDLLVSVKALAYFLIRKRPVCNFFKLEE